ncbi:probable protein arginine N-methyltransferase 1.2 isoform X2 [Coffea arabica]|uniref:Probable protein arginine N-methyltransferase 1.2 isoform X2 n=1 Tax=Coffea arabica TaxID=13443 RepID=A0ABM4UNI6_COFAR
MRVRMPQAPIAIIPTKDLRRRSGLSPKTMMIDSRTTKPWKKQPPKVPTLRKISLCSSLTPMTAMSSAPTKLAPITTSIPTLTSEMLKDVVRTKTYQNVIYKNSFLFRDKVVLDVGAGTGILSLFCAKVGAKHVYAIECSSMADMAQEIVKLNGFSDVITVIKGKVEEIELPVAQVDVIISEWMGYFLLYENMLDTVLYARNKWLVADGLVLPDKATLYLTAIEDADYKEDKIEFWNNVYGFDMSCIRKQSIMEPLVDTVDQNQIVTNCQMLKTMDISKMATGDASFTAPFKLVAERNDYIHALVAYFDVSFTKCHKLMGFSTGPKSRATHWKQTVLYLEDVLTVCQGESIVGSMTVAPNKKNPRDVDIMLKYSINGRRCQASRTQFYRMR